MPTGQVVAPGELRALARRYITIMEPGEVLIVRVPASWPPRTVRELNEALTAVCSDPNRDLCIKVLVVPGDGMAVATAPLDPFPWPRLV